MVVVRDRSTVPIASVSLAGLKQVVGYIRHFFAKLRK